jgi:hypothetical protein
VLEFKLPPVQTTGGIVHPAGRGWAEAIEKAFATRKAIAPRAVSFEQLCDFFVGWGEKYLNVAKVAVELTVSGWKVHVRDSYTFSAEKDGERIGAETKARHVKKGDDDLVTEHCWSISLL